METKNMMKSLRERAKEFDARLPFLDGREKGDTNEIMGQIITIDEYGFLPNDAGEHYVCFTTRERSNKFYFGGTVLTARMIELDQDGYREAIQSEGLPVLLTLAKAKKGGRTYTNVTFFPEG